MTAPSLGDLLARCNPARLHGPAVQAVADGLASLLGHTLQAEVLFVMWYQPGFVPEFGAVRGETRVVNAPFHIARYWAKSDATLPDGLGMLAHVAGGFMD